MVPVTIAILESGIGMKTSIDLSKRSASHHAIATFKIDHIGISMALGSGIALPASYR